MRLNCFRSAAGHDLSAVEQPPRRVSTAQQGSSLKRGIRRVGTADTSFSTSSTNSSRSSSNASISKLPPCRSAGSEAKVEAMMMPVPPEPRPSRCLRLSQPKTYSNIVSAMKQSQGCREWRNFDVFHEDDVDDQVSADEVARQRAADCERKVRKFEKAAREAALLDTIG